MKVKATYTKAQDDAGVEMVDSCLDYLYENSSAQVNDAAIVVAKAVTAYYKTPVGRRAFGALGKRLGA